MTKPRQFYYVSAIDGSRRALIAGPYRTHALALAAVDRVRERAYTLDTRSWWWAWGTAGSDEKRTTPLGEED